MYVKFLCSYGVVIAYWVFYFLCEFVCVVCGLLCPLIFQCERKLLYVFLIHGFIKTKQNKTSHLGRQL